MGSKRKLTDSVIDDVIRDEMSRMRHVSYMNPLTYEMRTNITEGLIKTYPANKTIDYILDYFGKKIYTIDIERRNNIEEILVEVCPIEINLDELIKAFDLCGYFLGFPKRNTISPTSTYPVELQFEPKFQSDDTKLIKMYEDVLFHATPSYNKNKILKIGLSPRMKNDLFDFPGRIYFSLGSSPERIGGIMKLLKDANKSLGNNGIYTLFAIDTKKLPDNVKLYYDPNYSYGCFTSNNIPPSCIVNYRDIDLNI